jgi:Protein of unknown function (DUF3501)
VSHRAPGAFTLDDIVDLRAYERVREGYRAKIIARKRPRRVALGPLITLVFECGDTVRFQIQEMVRAERILTDEGIQTELDVYNPLLPAPGELSATAFIELRSDVELREWLPRLVGIEGALGLEVGDPAASFVAGQPEPDHEAQFTRDEVTAAVHYIRFPFAPAQIDLLARGGAALVARHPAYEARTELETATGDELLGDLRGTTALTPVA